MMWFEIRSFACDVHITHEDCVKCFVELKIVRNVSVLLCAVIYYVYICNFSLFVIACVSRYYYDTKPISLHVVANRIVMF